MEERAIEVEDLEDLSTSYSIEQLRDMFQREYEQRVTAINNKGKKVRKKVTNFTPKKKKRK